MQAIMETLFDVLYLTSVITAGLLLLRNNPRKSPSWSFGLMALILGAGDAFHLVPRAYALMTDGLANHAVALGRGKFITSLTMTIFYLVLYRILSQRYGKKNRGWDWAMGLFGLLRFGLCLMPQNRWTDAEGPLLWGILRNLPFAAMGILVMILAWKGAKEKEDAAFRPMGLAIFLSFLFYVPVVLWADRYPLVGILMIPKTLAYVWVVWMGFREYLQAQKNHQVPAL
ncbi:hypothetical protein KCG48_09095 [Proteiniclasticum sp. BAD-10]|uniref:Uncharacterized protein n=1 Tax=Proteiniclasticum sediminis TaxID=2804028 RepID=A0A941CPR0_9CLOT|nr:hypothetical protein [Proteiniclasticum sediminis]MBR0576495.1 hypothetical protein [Proteiniclasticum sediminis]